MEVLQIGSLLPIQGIGILSRFAMVQDNQPLQTDLRYARLLNGKPVRHTMGALAECEVQECLLSRKVAFTGLL